MKKYYEILGLNEDATLEDVNDAFIKVTSELYHAHRDGKISRADYVRMYNDAEVAHDYIISEAKREAADAALFTEVEKNVEKEAEKISSDAKKDEKKEESLIRVVTPVSHKDDEEEDLDDDYSDYEYDDEPKKKVNGWKIATGVLAVALAAVVGFNAIKGLGNSAKRTGAFVNGVPAATEQVVDTPQREANEVVVQQTPSANTTTTNQQAGQNSQVSQSNQIQNYGASEYVVDLGDVENDTLVRARAQELVDQMNAAGIVNPTTTVPYSVDEVFKLIKYANGVYTPATVEEIDILHLDLLNLMISQLNTDAYLYHVVFANGNNDFNNLLDPNVKNVGFAEAFAEYGNNGVYPLIQWIQQKRFDMYSSTDREEINRIYREVGQVMADIMKGNGCTIVLKSGKEAKEGITYTFTSEQVLANHSSALILTTEAQLIFANHYQIRNENNEIIDEVSRTWEVYNKLNSDGVDANGQPIINPDIVSYEEINAWINNGCDYDWQIEDVLIGGQTFGQRIQSDMEGMALNNYKANSDNKSLSK